jgi:protein-S-isoprenylcysteine O-methyltransferase Ste14
MNMQSRAAAAIIGIAAAVLLLGNGRDPWLWLYALSIAGVLLWMVGQLDEDLLRERFRPPSAGADPLAVRLIRLVALAHLVVGLADSRAGWTSVPAPLRAAGVLGFVFCAVLIARAMRANRFFSAVVRIQRDRGHTVVDSGPYGVIRHPGYAAMSVLVPMSGLALGSWIATAVACVYSALILRRAAFEDRYLRGHLEGYPEYAGRVRYRVMPGVW